MRGTAVKLSLLIIMLSLSGCALPHPQFGTDWDSLNWTPPPKKS